LSVHLDGSLIVLDGVSRVEDAEQLLGWLQADRSRLVDLTDSEHLHAAVFQVLMALKPFLKGAGKNAFMTNWLTPALTPADAIVMSPPVN
jgi:hypothetical protein